MTKLYEVRLLAYVLADSAEEACMVAAREVQDGEAKAFPAEFVLVDYWDSLPYRNFDSPYDGPEQTCGEIVTAYRQRQARD